MNSPRCAVLIVEDEQSVQQLLQAILRRHCSSVDTASDGEEAMRLLDEREFDVVVLDLMLPKANGFQVAEKIRALPKPPRIIVLSAISRHFRDRFPEGTIVLQKPFELHMLEEALAKARA